MLSYSSWLLVLSSHQATYVFLDLYTHQHTYHVLFLKLPRFISRIAAVSRFFSFLSLTCIKIFCYLEDPNHFDMYLCFEVWFCWFKSLFLYFLNVLDTLMSFVWFGSTLIWHLSYDLLKPSLLPGLRIY